MIIFIEIKNIIGETWGREEELVEKDGVFSGAYVKCQMSIGYP